MCHVHFVARTPRRPGRRTRRARPEKDELARLRAELEGSRLQYRAVLDNFPNGSLVVVDRNLRVLAWGGTRLFSTGDPGSRVGRDLADLLSPSEMKEFEPIVLDALRGVPVRREVLLRGTILDLSVQPVRAGSGEVSFAVATIQDVTQRRRAQEALRESERWLRLSQGIARIGHYVFDIGRDHWTSSETLNSLFGIDASFPRTAADWLRIVHPDDQATMGKYLGDLLAGGIRFDREYRVVDQSSGETRWVHGLGELLRSAGGEPLQLVGTIQDVTARRRADDALRQSQKLESIGRLAGGVAHDFNNLLTVILSCGEDVLHELGRGSIPDPGLVEDMVGAARRASGLTRQLLAFARKDAFAPEIVHLDELIRGSRKLLGRLLGADVRIAEELQLDLWPVRCDPGQIGQVVMNLAVNARDAMPSGGTLTFAAENFELAPGRVAPVVGMAPGQYVRLTVRDTGQGMSAEAMEHLFEPFFTTKPPGMGTGLGLPTVYGIVKQTGAYLAVESRQGHGASFSIWFPRMTESAVEETPRPAGRRLGLETVLVVEDDPKVRRVAVRALESGGYRVLAASGGEEAFRLAHGEGGPVHLVLADVVMPGLGGREVARRVLELKPEARVLYVSGYTRDAIGKEGVMDEGIEFLPKPFTASTLLGRVRALLDQPRSP
jgi:PAS domain S-box-containing protein